MRRRKTDTLPTCMNCGAVLYGAYCSQCGQRSAQRITLGGSVRDFVRRLRRLDSRWIRTLAALTLDPGRMIRRYLHGRRLPFVPPVAYGLALTTLFVVVVWAFRLDLTAPGTPWSTTGQSGASHAEGPYLVFAVCAYLGLFAAWGTAAVQRQLFRRQSGYSLTETYVFGLYVFGHLAVHQTLFALLGAFSSTVGLVALSVVLVLILGFSLAGLYRRRLLAMLPAAALLGTVQVALVFVAGAVFRLLWQG